MKKIIFVLFIFISLCFGQTLQDLEEKAEKYGVDNADKFFSHEYGYMKVGNKRLYILDNLDKYKLFVNIEIINILEETASSKKRLTYEAFVKKHRGEPNMTDDRARNFRETGYYIDEYEKYVGK